MSLSLEPLRRQYRQWHEVDQACPEQQPEKDRQADAYGRRGLACRLPVVAPEGVSARPLKTGVLPVTVATGVHVAAPLGMV